MPNTYWKAVERQRAWDFGSRRIGATGFHSVDFISERYELDVEVVCHDIPQWLRQELLQAIRAAAVDKFLPVVIVHEKGTTSESDVVVIPYRHFRSWVMQHEQQNPKP
jgi:hypothetical protein